MKTINMAGIESLKRKGFSMEKIIFIFLILYVFVYPYCKGFYTAYKNDKDKEHKIINKIQEELK